MTPSQAQALLPVIAAFANGQAIQCRPSPNQSWYDVGTPSFDPDFAYRIKPAPKYRPWTQDEVPVGKVVRDKEDGSRQLITAARDELAYLPGGYHLVSSMLEHFTMDDGSPCGVLES